MTEPFCPRQIIFELPGTPGVIVTATERDGEIDFIIDVENTTTATGDLRALFFHFTESKLGNLVITSDDPLLTDSLILANSVLDLGDGATLAGKVKQGFDIGLEWGTPGGKKDDIDFPVTFTLASTTTDLTLDDFADLLFGAKLDSVGGPGGVRKQASKLTAIAPWAPDAKDDAYTIFEDGADGFDSPSKDPQELTFNVVAENDVDGDGDEITITGFHDEEVHGTLAISADGKSVLYTPDLDFSGVDTFEYCVSDGNGGQDSALVTVTVEAVADDPVFEWSVVQGSTINEMIVTVTATENDADSSEFLDRLVADTLPAGWSLTPLSKDPATEDNSVTEIFTLTVPTGEDVDADLSFTAWSKETSNGDEESAQLVIPIEIDFTHNETDRTFSTDDQSIWSTGDEEIFHEEPFIGLEDQPFSMDALIFPLAPLPLPWIDIAVAGDVTFGFDTVLHFEAGGISADLNVTLIVETTYNKTTDALLFDPSYILTGGSFTSTGPSGSIDVDFEFDVNGNVNIAIEPLDAITGWANFDVSLDTAPIDIDILNVDTDNLSASWDLLPGIVNFSLFWPDIAIDSPGSLTGSASDTVATLGIDVDAAAATIFPPLEILDPPGDLELLDVDITGIVDLIQELEVTLQGLTGTMTLEDGTPFAFDFGAPLAIISDVSSHDTNVVDGVVDFNLSISPEVTLTSESSVGFALDVTIEALKGLPFDIGSIDVYSEELPLGDITVFNDTFALLGFNNQSWDLSV